MNEIRNVSVAIYSIFDFAPPRQVTSRKAYRRQPPAEKLSPPKFRAFRSSAKMPRTKRKQQAQNTDYSSATAPAPTTATLPVAPTAPKHVRVDGVSGGAKQKRKRRRKARTEGTFPPSPPPGATVHTYQVLLWRRIWLIIWSWGCDGSVGFG